MLRIKIIPHLLHFKQPAGTSRGIYRTRKVWYLLLTSTEDEGKWGVGECAPLPNLSCDDVPEYEQILVGACRRAEETGALDAEPLRDYPSILFGLETAFRHFERGFFELWDTPFSRGESGLPTNGLIWMGDVSRMLEQAEEKIKNGFHCLKLKIGALDFEKELELLKHIRREFASIDIRVDANGAFAPADAMNVLNRLAELNIHSIEQPIRAGQWADMASLAEKSPVPIALDEELIGCNGLLQKRALLEGIKPQYIILKPSLHGGWVGCNEWIAEAERLGIGWWITSALESNVGLNAIAQWCASLNVRLPQGLGTGALFADNIGMPLEIRGESLRYAPSGFFPDRNFFSHDELHLFLSDWFGESPTIQLQTSGSTGSPKTFLASKEKMANSARMTCSFLGLQKNDKALLCMPLQYIGAKMVVVRALTAGLNLIVRKPSGHPLADVDTPIEFAAMVPLQVYNSLQVPAEREKLSQIRHLIIGGGAIDEELEASLSAFPNRIYSTYGMTETLSHIALRRLNGPEASAYYTPLPGVSVSLGDDGCLMIHAPALAEEVLYTGDIAEVLDDGRFRILGRKDNVINSGGIKLQAEEIERKLKSLLPFDFAVVPVPDPRLGEAVTLLSSGEISHELRDSLSSLLDKYERPRHIFKIDRIPFTPNGKVDRAESRRLAHALHAAESPAKDDR